MSNNSGAGTLANELLEEMIAGKDFTFPSIDIDDPSFASPATDGALFDEVTPLDVEDLTTGVVNGTGVFDRLMSSLVAHLKVEYEANRISGAEYTRAYIGIISAALQTSAQYLLGKDQAYWQALLIQKQAQIANAEAVKARVDLAKAKYEFVRAQYEASNAEAAYGLTKIRISVEDAQFGNLLRQGEGIDYTNEFILPQQKSLLEEQTETQRAQTSNVRTDLDPVAGLIGKQKDLYTQQIESYKRDAETKAAKIFADAWITQKTVDEGLLPPTQFNNASVDSVIGKLRSNLNLT